MGSFDKPLGKFKKAVDKIVNAYDEIVKTAAYTALREAKQNLRKGKNIYTGMLLNSLEARKLTHGIWGVGSSVKYMWYLEYGTRPHKVPLPVLVKWVALKNKWYGKRGERKAYPIARAVQLSIMKHGTKPHPYLRPAEEEVRKKIKEIARGILRKTLR